MAHWAHECLSEGMYQACLAWSLCAYLNGRVCQAHVHLACQVLKAAPLSCTGRSAAIAILDDTDVASVDFARRAAETALHDSDIEVHGLPLEGGLSSKQLLDHAWHAKHSSSSLLPTSLLLLRSVCHRSLDCTCSKMSAWILLLVWLQMSEAEQIKVVFPCA